MIDGTLAITGRGLTRGGVAAALQPHGLIAEGNALMNLGFAASSVFGAALAGLPDRRLRASPSRCSSTPPRSW